jgi:hypothetical protein
MRTVVAKSPAQFVFDEPLVSGLSGLSLMGPQGPVEWVGSIPQGDERSRKTSHFNLCSSS